MLTIFVGRKDIPLSDVTGFTARVRTAVVKEEGKYVSLQDSQPFQEYDDIEIALTGRLITWRLHLTSELKEAIKLFMRTHHAQQNLEVDCYAFANLVKGVVPHDKAHLLRFWRVKKLLGKPTLGSVVFFVKGQNHFRHAAVYIGRGLCISVWGAGGDLEIASLRSMKKDFDADRIEIAVPR